MIAGDKPGWFTYRIRKKSPLGARYAAYRFTRGLPGLIRSAGRKLASIMRKGIGPACQPPNRHGGLPPNRQSARPRNGQGRG